MGSEMCIRDREYLSAPGDAQALASAITHILGDDVTRRQEAQRLGTLVRNRYGLDVTVSALTDLYGELMAAHAAA